MHIKKYILSIFLIIACVLVGNGCTSSSETDVSSVAPVSKDNVVIDYDNDSLVESALNNGEDLTGKVVRFKVAEYKPDSALGFNCWSGEHLNFVSKTDIKAKSDDYVVGKISKVSKKLGSWNINYDFYYFDTDENVAVGSVTQNEIAETPIPTFTSVPAPTATDTPIPTATNTPEPTATHTPELTATNTPVPSPTVSPNSGDRIVYIAPDSGAKYHYKKDCRGLKKANAIEELTIDEAKKRGYTLCGYED